MSVVTLETSENKKMDLSKTFSYSLTINSSTFLGKYFQVIAATSAGL